MMYRVELIILNKDGVRDPEGETLKRYVVDSTLPGKVAEVRVGKIVVVTMEASSREEAEKLTRELAEQRRLYNPIVHKLQVRAEKVEDGSD
ncbi:Phosphoribosylformylglycinamidine synthase subunit PurS [Metallosphaera sp. J1]|uniref:phosphoribosylformylglycinamidine synthase subunit PurS n=1 Tax=Metallosphaera TaxID=41980 RepID=UPI001EDFEB62|nr:phosphoribosylformylglycinamidine synthase subunit PurS [Metallosphaera javensis (ex Hofmann et al. 2022)]MCG3108641.1 Phosphoribosylformylglycinamidine synthase subunit PurS [Metallosphaera javensis (ex Hofmann et al. 2022)]BCS91670.1 MAG: phosphoribosylformylglycinamidine synthase subunit PurS [Metallosphaera javensis (ex Sakai et al. 2022)]